MLIARVSFIDPSDGQPIEAGRTHVAQNSDVARMFPDRFEAAGSGRAAVTRSQSTARKRLPAPLPPELDEVPVLRTELQTGFSVHLGSGALRGILEEFERSDWLFAHHVESGGCLFGRQRASSLDLLAASGPGNDEKARRFENACMISLSEGLADAAELRRQYDDSLVGVVGSWHVHPESDATPSPTDRAHGLLGLSELEREMGWRAPTRWVDVILTPDAARGWDAPFATAWATRRQGQWGSVTERVRIEGG
jgi:hypothetical protein